MERAAAGDGMKVYFEEIDNLYTVAVPLTDEIIERSPWMADAGVDVPDELLARCDAAWAELNSATRELQAYEAISNEQLRRSASRAKILHRDDE